MDRSLPIQSTSQASSAWARLPTWEEHERPRWVWIAISIAIVIWGFTDVRRRARIDPQNPTVHKTDFTVYTEAGAAFFDGRDPYAVTNPRGWHYLYPPLFAIAVAPLASLGTQTQAVVWYFVSVAACFGTWFECRRLRRWLSQQPHVVEKNAQCDWPSPSPLPNGEESADEPPVWLGWLAAATVALPAMNCLQRGQVGVVLAYLLLAGLRLVVTSVSMRGVFLGGIALALAVTIKLTPLLPAGLLALVLLARAFRHRGGYADALVQGFARGRMNRAIATAAGGCVGLVLFVLIVPGSLLGHAANIGHLRTWVSRVVANDEVGVDNDFNARSKRNQSLTNAVQRLGNRLAFAAGAGPDDRLVDDLSQEAVRMPMENAAVGTGLSVVTAGLVGLLLVAGWRVAGRGDATGIVAVFGLACAATLAVSPISWGHHYVVWLPALVFVPYWMWNNDRRAMAIGMAESALVLVVAHYLLLDHAGRVGLLGIGTAIWYVGGIVALGWPRCAGAAVEATIVLDGENNNADVRRRAA